MGFSILVRCRLYIDSGPRSPEISLSRDIVLELSDRFCNVISNLAAGQQRHLSIFRAVWSFEIQFLVFKTKFAGITTYPSVNWDPWVKVLLLFCWWSRFHFYVFLDNQMKTIMHSVLLAISLNVISLQLSYLCSDARLKLCVVYHSACKNCAAGLTRPCLLCLDVQ